MLYIENTRTEFNKYKNYKQLKKEKNVFDLNAKKGCINLNSATTATANP